MQIFRVYTGYFLVIIIFLFSCENISIPPEIDKISFTEIGKIKNKTTHEIQSSTWSIGGETLDRGYAVYDHYKDN